MLNNLVFGSLSWSAILVDTFIASCDAPPEEIILDFDVTNDAIHGGQQGRFFHGLLMLFRTRMGERHARPRQRLRDGGANAPGTTCACQAEMGPPCNTFYSIAKQAFTLPNS